MAGWIKLHRSIKDWEWYGDLNVRVVFLHCLLTANYEDKRWQGKLVKRGSFLTGRDVLADEIGISVRNVRTALTKLKSTSELTIETTSKGTLVTLINYDKFQTKDVEVTSKMTSKTTNERPASDQQVTTTKKVRSKEYKRFVKPTPAEVLKYGMTLDPPFTQSDNFVDYNEAKGWKVGGSPMKDWEASVRTWNRRNTEKQQTQKAGQHKITEYLG